MGKASRSSRKDVRKRPALLGELAEIVPALMDFYDLTDEDALHELLTLLLSYSCRDQEGEPDDASPKDLTQRRTLGHKLAQQIVANAASALQLIDDIERARADFEGIVLDHPALLEEIFDVDVGPPDVLIYPAELSGFKTFYSDVGGKMTEAALAALAATPVRPKLNRGPVKNVILINAVAACRNYWRDHEKLPWSMSALKNQKTREEDNRKHLQGMCEAFVADVLQACGVRFTLVNLVTAWTEVDKLARKNNGKLPGVHKRQLTLSQVEHPGWDYAALMRQVRPEPS
ncbi:hypothetical protein [Sphingobium yanoikuyae]|uniref:hypothetical protein n=1 Tax=Sphingobium yanoikuyae TaxID=13690 RepID=UPI0012D2EEB0|nr:hypothetical protein [Sphingobium yanoikuyae]MDV3480838.1 hypothetical protein [Sphingobium yanoikuyae]